MSGAVAAVIPARYGSTRLPAKPLLRETGKYLIQHVCERVREAKRIAHVIVATDDARIFDAVRSFGADVRMTSSEHASGTDRIAEVARGLDVAAVLNVQGDEPDIDPADLDAVAAAVLEPGAEIVTLAVPIRSSATYADRNAVKVVADAAGRALYFSRSPIPWTDRAEETLARGLLKKHLGVYGYRRDVLFRFAALPRSPLEELERLEQLRALHHGISIRVLDARHESIGIDTADDYRRFVDRLNQDVRYAR